MSFKDLQYSISKLTTNVQSQVARNNPLQNPDTKCLNYWLFQERNELAVLKTKTYQHTETNKAFREWVDEEREKNKDTDYEDDIKVMWDILCILLVYKLYYSKWVEPFMIYLISNQSLSKTILVSH